MNKKLFALLMVAGAGLSANAQQLPNGTFDDAFVKCYPWEKGNKVTKDYGTQPEGWCVSNVPNSVAGAMGSQVEGYNGKAVKLTNADALGNAIPAYMTLGTAWATAEANIKGDTRNTDGGVFGGIEFSYRPDAVSLWYKRDGQGKVDESVVAVYSWKGTWTQKDVPSNTAVSLGYGTATKVTMTDRDVNILGQAYNVGGEISKTDDAQLVASASQTITGSVTEWTELEVPLTYETTTVKPEKLNIVISAAGYQSDAEKLNKGVSITVDDVKMVYWNTLTSLSYDGEEIPLSTETTFECEKEYDPELLVYVAKSQFAEVDVKYDEETGLCTITVSREGAEEDMVYKIQFQCWNTLTSLTYDGMNYLSNPLSTETEFECDEEFDIDLLEYVTKSKSASVTVSYDDETALCTVTVTREGAENKDYTIQFKKPEPVVENDVCKDGKLDAEDVAAIVRIVLGSVNEGEVLDIEAADVNGDGKVTIADITELIKRLTGEGNNE